MGVNKKIWEQQHQLVQELREWMEGPNYRSLYSVAPSGTTAQTRAILNDLSERARDVNAELRRPF